MACSTENLVSLSSILSSNISTYLERLSAADIPPPTLRPAPPVYLTDDAAIQAKDEIIKSCERILALVQSPVESMLVLSESWLETSALQIALDMKLHKHIPLNGDVSLDVLAEKVRGSKDLITRVLRALINRNCFVETSPGHYAHTGLSSTLTVPTLEALIAHNVDEPYKSGPHIADVVRENNFTVPDDAAKTPFNRAFKTDKPFFEHIYGTDPVRAERFGLAMSGISAGHNPQHTYTPLKDLPTGTTVVDVGGGLGQACISMAPTCPGPKFVVQDLPSVVSQGQEHCPKELRDRIEYQASNFFEEQLVKGADVYYLKHILHDHPDSNCRRILSQIVAAMDPKKSRILLNELIVAEQVGPDQKRITHLRDFQMLALCNSLERTESQWRALLKSADERLVLEKVWGQSAGNVNVSSTTILEFRLRV